jgi:hypothetical protein
MVSNPTSPYPVVSCHAPRQVSTSSPRLLGLNAVPMIVRRLCLTDYPFFAVFLVRTILFGGINFLNVTRDDEPDRDVNHYDLRLKKMISRPFLDHIESLLSRKLIFRMLRSKFANEVQLNIDLARPVVAEVTSRYPDEIFSLTPRLQN